MPYKLALENIKNYLIKEGVKVDNMIMYQGGFVHDGYNYGLEIIATFETNGKEERYYVPKYLLYTSTQIKYLNVDNIKTFSNGK